MPGVLTRLIPGCAVTVGFTAALLAAPVLPGSIATAQAAAQTETRGQPGSASDAVLVYSAPMDVIHGKPYVNVLINGKGPYRFLVDTGTSAEAVITPELAGELQLPARGTGKLSDPTRQGAQEAPVRVIDTLTVAGLDFYSIRTFEHALLGSDGGCQGMLGFTLFQGLLLTLDYPQGRLVLEHGGELRADGEKSVHRFRMPDGVPVVELTIGSVKLDAMLDSGGAGLNIPERFAPQLKFAAEPALFGKAHSLSSIFDVRIARLAMDVHFGDITFDHPWVELNSAFPTANFGAVPLQHFTVTFDRENLMVRLAGAQKHVTLEVTPAPLEREPAGKTAPGVVPVG